MSPTPAKILSALSLATAVAVTGYVPVAQAMNFGDFMNPGRWFGGGNRDRYDDEYYGDEFGPWGGGPYGGGPYGGYGPYGAPYGGYGGYGGPYGGYGGYGAPYGGYGYGMPGYGGYGVPAYGAPAASAPAQSSTGGSKNEIDALKRRIEELESQQRQPQQQAPSSSDWPSSPAFRPMNQY